MIGDWRRLTKQMINDRHIRRNVSRQTVPKSRSGQRNRPCTKLQTGGTRRWLDDADLSDDDALHRIAEWAVQVILERCRLEFCGLRPPVFHTWTKWDFSLRRVHSLTIQPITHHIHCSTAMEASHHHTQSQSPPPRLAITMSTNIHYFSLIASYGKAPFQNIQLSITSPATDWLEFVWSICVLTNRMHYSCPQSLASNHRWHVDQPAIRASLCFRLQQSIWYSPTLNSAWETCKM